MNEQSRSEAATTAASFRLENAFLNAAPIELWNNDVVLLAVSGGADSMALLELFSRFATDLDLIKVVHVNHGTRGLESDGDEDFVMEQCLERGVEFLSVRLDSEQMISHSEESLRKLRYKAIEESALAVNAKWVAFGHHLDDNIETFFQRLLRGTGLRGLECIPTQRSLSKFAPNCQLIRPLLQVPQAAIAQWLAKENVPYRLDSSNLTDAYLRNRIRTELIPVIESLGINDWRMKISTLIEDVVLNNRLHQKSTVSGPNEIEICIVDGRISFPVHEFRIDGWEVLRNQLVESWMTLEWPLQHMNRKHWNSIRELLFAATQTTHPQRMHLPNGIRLLVRKGTVCFYRELAENSKPSED